MLKTPCEMVFFGPFVQLETLASMSSCPSYTALALPSCSSPLIHQAITTLIMSSPLSHYSRMGRASFWRAPELISFGRG